MWTTLSNANPLTIISRLSPQDVLQRDTQHKCVPFSSRSASGCWTRDSVSLSDALVVGRITGINIIQIVQKFLISPYDLSNSGKPVTKGSLLFFFQAWSVFVIIFFSIMYCHRTNYGTIVVVRMGILIRIIEFWQVSDLHYVLNNVFSLHELRSAWSCEGELNNVQAVRKF